mmetsp:Transcript_10883/g.23125  ORF Transcript_10883/g.23125 Transcript_10883/m.23125 type:complete len:116 (+) Transcript_10883:280-627(+)
MSDYPYEHGPAKCWKNDLESYCALENKIFVTDGRYHPALDTVVLTSEPDLLLAGVQGQQGSSECLSWRNGERLRSPPLRAFTGALSHWRMKLPPSSPTSSSQLSDRSRAGTDRMS